MVTNVSKRIWNYSLTGHLAYVSMQRIEGFLGEEEVSDWASPLKTEMKGLATLYDDIGFENASFAWHAESSKTSKDSRFILGPLTLRIPKNSLTLITGATGSGKSAMLAALLGGKIDLQTTSVEF